MEKIPLVSVVIPMYNSAKFIEQTLESLRYQTLKNFEVIIVDDCSTDNSIEVVENFAPRLFQAGIKVHLLELPKNTGMPGLPRNIGMQFTRGKYIAFLDSDDLYTPTALEELTTLAEDYQADGVHTDEYFNPWNGKAKFVDDPAFTDMNAITNSAHFVIRYKSKHHPDKPTFLTEDLGERVKKYLRGGYYFSGRPYLTLWKRDFLIGNQITFPPLRVHEDQIYGINCLFLAEKILRVPNICCIHRERADSISYEQISIESEIKRDLRIYIDGFDALKKIMDGIDFFAAHPDYRYAVLDWYIISKLWYLQNLYEKFHPVAFDSLIVKEFRSDDANFAAYLFHSVNLQRLQIMRLAQENDALKKSLQQR